MLYYLFEFLENQYQFPGAGLFQYLSFRASVSVILSLGISIIYGKKIIQYLRKEILYARNMYKILRSFGKQGRGTIGQNLRGLVVYHTVLPVLFQYLANGLPGVLAPWDEEDGEEAPRAGPSGVEAAG